MDGLAAGGAVEHEQSEFAFDLCLHLEQLQAERLRVNGEWMGAVEARLHRLIDDRAGSSRLFAQRPTARSRISRSGCPMSRC